MKLRYIHIYNFKPLNDISITFAKESILSRECAIRFVVGLNSSGKTRFLQALANIFRCLKDGRLPPFPVILAYDLGVGKLSRTIYINNKKDVLKTAFIEFDKVIPLNGIEDMDLESIISKYPIRNKYLHGDLPGTGSIDSYLPKVLLAYTSGDDLVWSTIFNSPPAGSDVSFDAPSLDKERPLYYYNTNMFEEISKIDTGIFVEHDSLKLAICAAVLYQLNNEFRRFNDKSDENGFILEITESIESGKRMEGLRGLLNEIDWLWPVSIGFHIKRFEKNNEILDYRNKRLLALYNTATSIIQDPSPGINDQFSSQIATDHLLFDLRNPLPNGDITAEALASVISGSEKSTAFDFFKQLYQLNKEGILLDIKIAFRKRNLNDILLLNWLSDGEQLFLGRMALFYLLKDQDDSLIILDEPDTHFNDFWKREIVDIIDENLRNMASDIIISTHSSIALTDVFDSEIILLCKDRFDGSVFIAHPQIRSFGASPNEIMLHIFNTPETVGQRAAEFLDLVLMIAAHPDDVEKIWAMDGDDAIKETPEFQRLMEHARSLPHNYGNDEKLEKYLVATLLSIYNYSKFLDKEKVIHMADVLSDILDKIGAGYYQFEFSRRLHALRGPGSNAS